VASFPRERHRSPEGGIEAEIKLSFGKQGKRFDTDDEAKVLLDSETLRVSGIPRLARTEQHKAVETQLLQALPTSMISETTTFARVDFLKVPGYPEAGAEELRICKC